MTPPTIPATMKAAILAEGADGLEIVRIPTPLPKSGEALIQVIACGVCHSDLHVIRGEVAFPRPAVLGHEISGRVVQLGPDTIAGEIVVGTTVVAGFIIPCGECDACVAGRDDVCEPFFAQNRLRGTLYDGESRLTLADGSFLAMYSMGGLAEFAVVPVSALVPLPPELDPVSSCTLGCAGMTAYGAVTRAGRVAPGDAVAVLGVGGVGSAVVQLARAAGATTIIAVDIADDKLQRAIELGATHSVNSSETDPVVAVRDITGGGVDVAFEALGLPVTFRQAGAMLASGGRMVAIGIASGTATGEVEITPLVRRGHTIIGSFGGRTRVDLPAVVKIAASGAFDAAATVSRRYRLEDADDAYTALGRGEITGRAVIVMED